MTHVIQVRLLRDVETTVGLLSEGLALPASPTGDGWLLHLSLRDRVGTVHTEYVPDGWATPC